MSARDVATFLFVTFALAVIGAVGALSFPISSMLAPAVRVMSHEGIHIGSGVALSDWIVLTNKHVAAEDDLTIEFSTKERRPGRVVWRSPDLDLAAIGVAVPESVQPATLTCRKPQLGEPVATLGHPSYARWVLTQGHVASLERAQLPQSMSPNRNPTSRDSEVDILLDLSVFKGNSGGPVYDTDGHVIGLIYALVNGAQNPLLLIPIGLSVMIPSSAFCAEVQPLLTGQS